MTTTTKSPTIDAAAQASIGAAARELHLPTVRTEAARLAEIATRNGKRTWPIWPRFSLQRSMSAPNDGAPAGSTTRSSRD